MMDSYSQYVNEDECFFDENEKCDKDYTDCADCPIFKEWDKHGDVGELPWT